MGSFQTQPAQGKLPQALGSELLDQAKALGGDFPITNYPLFAGSYFIISQELQIFPLHVPWDGGGGSHCLQEDPTPTNWDQLGLWGCVPDCLELNIPNLRHQEVNFGQGSSSPASPGSSVPNTCFTFLGKIPGITSNLSWTQDLMGFEAPLLCGLSFSSQGVLEMWEIGDLDLLKKVENEDIFGFLSSGCFSSLQVCPVEQQGSRNVLIPLKPVSFAMDFTGDPLTFWKWALLLP